MQLSIHLKYRNNEFAGYGCHILDDLGCFCTILTTCDQIRQLQTAGTVDHEIVSVPTANETPRYLRLESRNKGRL